MFGLQTGKRENFCLQLKMKLLKPANPLFQPSYGKCKPIGSSTYTFTAGIIRFKNFEFGD